MKIIISTLMWYFIAAGFIYTVYNDIKNPYMPEAEAAEETPDPVVIAQTNSQIEYYNKQLTILRRIEKDAESAYNTALETINQDKALNKYSMIVPQKIVLKHIKERDAAANKLISARTRINNFELKKAKLYN